MVHIFWLLLLSSIFSDVAKQSSCYFPLTNTVLSGFQHSHSLTKWKWKELLTNDRLSFYLGSQATAGAGDVYKAVCVSALFLSSSSLLFSYSALPLSPLIIPFPSFLFSIYHLQH